MRKVVLYSLLSLDGVAEEPGDWMTDFGQPTFDEPGPGDRLPGHDPARPRDLRLLGGFWPGDGPEPFHSFINQTPKHVFTSRPLDAEWANTVVVDGPAADHVRALKQQEGGDIGIHGSLGLARSLVRDGLVDEYRLVVARPSRVAASASSVTTTRSRRLELVDLERTPAGTLLLGYRSADPVA